MMYSYTLLNKKCIRLLLLILMVSVITNFSALEAAEQQSAIASFAPGIVDTADFDILGTVENTNFQVNEDTAAEQGEAGQSSIMLNGEEYLFSPDAGIFNVDALSIDMKDIAAGSEVCFNVDPSNLIVELYLLQNNPEIMDDNIVEPEDEKGHSNQPNGSGEIRLENGVWVN